MIDVHLFPISSGLQQIKGLSLKVNGRKTGIVYDKVLSEIMVANN